MYIQSFRRYENKYLITRQTAELFLQKASHLLIPDEYGCYSISNIYLDTDDYYFITRSLDKPIYKEKLRIRRYGTDGTPDKVFFEIKKKYRKVVSKRRISLSAEAFDKYLSDSIIPTEIDGYTNHQIFNEIDWIMKRYSPVPKLYIAYDREAYFMDGHPDVRITFDRNIRSRQTRLTLDSGEGCELLNTGIDDYRLIEIKTAGAVPLEIAKILSELKIYPTSFSKYGRIFSNHILTSRKEITNV